MKITARLTYSGQQIIIQRDNKGLRLQLIEERGRAMHLKMCIIERNIQ